MRKKEIKMEEEIRKDIKHKKGRIWKVRRRSFGKRKTDGKAWWQDDIDKRRNTQGEKGEGHTQCL
jgi:hypothetical protein